MRKILVLLVVLTGMLYWQCSRKTSDSSLKSQLNEGVAKINTALTAVSQTKGYQLMTTSDLTKSGNGYSDSIDLDLVAGIYDFQPDTFICHHFMMPFWRFEKTAESEMMVLNLPQSLIFHPRFLHEANPPDTVIKNDFTITASDYHYYYSFMQGYAYKLTAGFALDDKDIGMLDVTAEGQNFAGRSYSTSFSFTDDYSVMVSYEKGDTSVSSFVLKEGDNVLLGEKTFFVWKDFHQSERKYTLTIGDIDIVRGSKIDSIEVYLNGVLQTTAAAVISDDEDNGDGEHSVCHYRDILLTFDDGSTAKLSDLIGPSLDTLKTLVDPMREMYFAKHIVDYLALTIYYQNR
jgi:hypothetical protein